MQERTFENLILDGNDLFLEGDITIKGSLKMKNSNLIVSGYLTISCNDTIEIENGDIIVSGELIINADLNIKGVNISCDRLYCSDNDVNISDGDIWTNTYLNAQNITSDGNIETRGDCSVSNVTCLNYLITGDNDSFEINASQDIYILGGNYSKDLTARDILINGSAECGSITAHHFVCTGGLSCEELFIE